MQPTETASLRSHSVLPSTILAVVLGVLVLVSAPAPAQQDSGPSPMSFLPAGADRAAATIDRATLRAPVRFLADDLLGGRGPATRGDRLARLYLSTELESMGYQPAFDGSWQQPFDVVGINAHPPKTWTFSAGSQDVTLDFWDDFIAASGVQADTSTIDDAEVVFVGYGIQAPEYDWDDFKGADLQGKVLLMLNNDPDWSPDLFEGKTRLYYGRWTYKYESAARQGAAGAIIIHTTPSAGYPWQVVQTSWTGEQFELPAGDEPRIQVAAWTTEDATRRLLSAAGKDLDTLIEQAHHRDFQPVPLGIRTSLSMHNDISSKRTANVGGLLPGSDPELAKQVVVYTAHHDHLGEAPADGAGDDQDRIYNGALDNGAGDAQVLAIARAYRELPRPPKRTTLFLFVAGEEQGLLGSKYFAQNPIVPPGRLAANINYDGGNIWGAAEDVTLIGAGKSTIDRVAEAVAASQGRTVEPDQNPDKGYYYRSDQFSLAKIGVPALYFDTGSRFVGRPEGWGQKQVDAWVQEHYHQPSDELTDDWNFDGMIQDAQLGLLCGLILSEQPEMPSWLPGDEFEAARQKALESLNGH